MYNEKDPFKILDDEHGYVEPSNTLFDQPPTTKWELWSYYLYYNGVRHGFTYRAYPY